MSSVTRTQIIYREHSRVSGVGEKGGEHRREEYIEGRSLQKGTVNRREEYTEGRSQGMD
jgi:hypothetical protein